VPHYDKVLSIIALLFTFSDTSVLVVCMYEQQMASFLFSNIKVSSFSFSRQVNFKVEEKKLKLKRLGKGYKNALFLKV
jgi:hypothetical protein